MSLHGSYGRGFRTAYSEAGGKTYCEKANGQADKRNPARRIQTSTGPQIFQHGRSKICQEIMTTFNYTSRTKSFS